MIGIVVAIASIEELLLFCITLHSLLFFEQRVCFCMVYAIPNLLAIIGVLVYRNLSCEIIFQQHINLGRDALQCCKVCCPNWCSPVFENGCHSIICILIGFLLLCNASHPKHIIIRQQEVIDLIDGTFYSIRIKLNFMRCSFPPFILFQFVSSLYSIDLITAIYFQPCTYYRITHSKSICKEWRFHILVDNIKPKRKFSQFNGSRI